MKLTISIVKVLVCIAIVSLSSRGLAQTGIRGQVSDAVSGELLTGAQVVVQEKYPAVTDAKGNYRIENIPAGTFPVKVNFLGYQSFTANVEVLNGRMSVLNIRMEPEIFTMGEVVVTANRFEEKLRNVPMRMHVISKRQLELQSATSADELIQYLPGVMISRSFGIFSTKSTVSMRGLGGNEQSRVLVLMDGVPVNKADGGSVNWNLVNTDMIDRIEVVKGPNSSLYGGNAMGGTINLISKRPDKPFSLRASLEYGTFQTVGGRISLSGQAFRKEQRFWYWSLAGHYRQSDGYITQSKADQLVNPYITKSNLTENSARLLLGYQFREQEVAEISVVRYDDSRGTGEVVFQEEGNVTDHDIWQLMGRYQRTRRNYTAGLSVFYNREDYKKVNEFMKDDYTYYKVLSTRTDFGGLFSFQYQGIRGHRIVSGLDIRNGAVDAYDKYYTSTDIVYNKGALGSFGLFVQDEIRMMKEQFRIQGGLRFDYARFSDGFFDIEAPTGETEFMNAYITKDFKGEPWHDISPRISFQYVPDTKSRLFLQFAHGFRAPVLDDMCRSGRMRGGFKVINPDLKPEKLNTLEFGADYAFSKSIRTHLSCYYSAGNDFQYYVGTGDSLNLGFGLRPVLIRDNISQVRIAGLEFSAEISLWKGLSLEAGYGLNSSVIQEYTPLNPLDQMDLSGNVLSEVPRHLASAYLRYVHPFVQLGVGVKYNGSRYVNDQNTYDDIVLADQYPDYWTVDVKLTKEINRFFISLSVQNLTDQLFYDSRGAVCPGRFGMAELGFKL